MTWLRGRRFEKVAQARQQYARTVQEEARERCENPRVQSVKLSGSTDRYKIKLRSVGYRLVYEVREVEILVVVIAIGKRDRGEIYRNADRRQVSKSAP